MDDKLYEEQSAAKLAELKPRLTEEFLATLVECARVDGYGGDYMELHAFVGWCHDAAGAPYPDYQPYYFGMPLEDQQ